MALLFERLLATGAVLAAVSPRDAWNGPSVAVDTWHRWHYTCPRCLSHQWVLSGNYRGAALSDVVRHGLEDAYIDVCTACMLTVVPVHR